MENKELHFPFTLRLYAHVYQSLRNHNFTGLDLFYRVKDCWKGRDTPNNLLVEPLVKGLSYKIGEWCFNTLFGGASESEPKSFIATLGDEEAFWFVDDVIKAAKSSGLFESAGLDGVAFLINEIELLYENDEDAYWAQLKTTRRRLLKQFHLACTSQAAPLAAMRELYAPEIADRLLHDRQLCSFIAETVMDIGFEGETTEGIRSCWMKRKKWPARVRTVVNERDRGVCAGCNTKTGLDVDGHIDHIFPISKGGCNDLVNLQLLCSGCNTKKRAKVEKVKSSVPRYVRRA